MKQLAAITDFVTRLNLVAAEDVDGWVQDISSITPSTTSLGVGGMILFRMSYTAVLVVDNYPHKRHPTALLFAHIIAWLLDNDSERFDREDPPIRTSVDIYDDRAAEIEIMIDFVEEVGVVEDANGPIRLDGKTYSLSQPEIYYALKGDLVEPVDLVLEGAE